MIYAFDDYELDSDRYELRRAGQRLRVEPKVFDLLVYLAQHQGQFVSKEMLFERLWPNQFVSETALTYCVTAARKAVGDTGRTQRVIKTVYGRGYRFIALVHMCSAPALDTTSPIAPLPRVEEPDTGAPPCRRPKPHRPYRCPRVPRLPSCHP